MKMKFLLCIWFFTGLSIGSFTYAQTVTTFNYTGGMQTYVVPAGVTSIEFDVIGAQGGNAVGTAVGWVDGDVDLQGGRGGRVTGTLSVIPGETLNLFVGGQGAMPAGGFNGGGDAATCSGTEVISAGGGGASDIRQGGTALADRVVVAGGGGGASGSPSTSYQSPDYSGPGGGLTGGDATVPSASDCVIGAGGESASGGTGGNNTCWCSNTDVAGSGTLGDGGSSVCAPSGLSTCACTGTGCTSGGGGGGGYYGGGAGICYAGGGGGSSYTSGAATSVTHTQGYQDGNGQIILTILCDPLTTTVSSDTVCEGDEVILHAESTNTGTISWSGGITDSVAFTPSVGTTTYTATSTDGDDCEFAIDILVGEYPTADAGMDTSICEGDSIQLVGTGSGTDLSWDGGFSDGDWITPSSAGTNSYELTVSVDSTGCATVDTLEVEYNVIDPTVSVSGIELTSNQAGAIYQWIDCSDLSDISGATNQSFTPTTDGDYAVIIDLNDCVDTSACETVFGVGMMESDFGNLSIKPNPSDGAFQIITDGRFVYEVTDLSGRTIQSGKADGYAQVYMGDAESGVYLVRVERGGKTRTTRLILK